MPDFEQRKHRSLTQKQLDEEYREMSSGFFLSRVKNKKEKKSPLSGSKNTSSVASKQAISQNKPQSSKGAYDKRPPASTRPKFPVSKNKEETMRAIDAAKKAKTFAGSKGALKRNKPSRPHTKRKTGKRQSKYTLYYIFIGVLVVIALSILSGTVLFNISVFIIKGETIYSQEDIIAACGIKKGENLLRINTNRAERMIISKLVFIEAAELHRGFPNRLTITVKPALPMAAYTYGDKYYLLSSENRLLEIIDSNSEYPVISGFSFDFENMPEVGDYISDDNEQRLSIVKDIASLCEKFEIKKNLSVDISDTIDIKMIYDGRVEIDLGTSSLLEAKITNLSLLIKDELGENEKCVINISNPNRVVKRPIRAADG